MSQPAHPGSKASSAQEQLEIVGTVQKVVFTSDTSSYTVFTFLPQVRGGESFSCVTSLPGVKAGASLTLQGYWVLHPRYGQNFQVTYLQEQQPTDEVGLLGYLSSGLFKGIGRARAAAIVKQFGMAALQVIAEDPEQLRLAGVPGKIAQAMQRTLQENRASQRLHLYLQSHGVSSALAMRIYNHYQDKEVGDLVAFIETNPYRLAEEVYGIGFRTADRLALALGISLDSSLRLKVGLSFCLSEAADEGHCFLPDHLLLQHAAQRLQVSEELLTPFLEALIHQQELIASQDGGEAEAPGERRIYLPAFYYGEKGVANRLQLYIDQGKANIFSSPEQLNRQIDHIQEQMALQLAPEQRQALVGAVANPLQIITGGPGTGKTTLLRALHLLFREARLRTYLAAPTGRAARRLSELTGEAASTIHRLLESTPQGGSMVFLKNEDNPLPADAVIVDEASMVDIFLFNSLLKALPPGCRLVLVGDHDQLPSVGPGQVLRDLIASQVIPVARLRTVFRQANQSKIISNAHRINQGLAPVLARQGSDFIFIPVPDPRQALQQVVRLCRTQGANLLPEGVRVLSMDDMQVLTPMRRGVVGVESLNRHLQEALNPLATVSSRQGLALDEEDDEKGAPELVSFGVRFRPGDKVMQQRNNYHKEVLNGDIGTVYRVDPQGDELEVLFPEGNGLRTVKYRRQELGELALAYAISVHKSQGSEYPVVVMPILNEHSYMLQRNLLYTAVTRAKKLLVLVGEQEVLLAAVRLREVRQRYTGLQDRLKE
ncbi:MAG: ATP-dependent RecD-like DNA helicase [Symbiobacteriaceae bacterium]|nr:ATP-dependent RecD-like DNA helicase [Symbiobacteriaceae bacterium]